MAIYHLHQGFVGRSSGRSSVQSAAYIAGEKLFEERREITADYTKRAGDVEFVNTLAPEHSKYKDLSVWNAVEKFEDKYAEKHYKREETIANYKESAQTASTIVLALPNELSVETNKDLLEKFINTRFTSRGLISTYAIHNNDGNLHAHIQTTRRAIDENGEFLERKDRAICTKSSLIETRKLWADLANEYLGKEGVLDRISEKSFADLGIDLDPSKHRGWFSDVIGDKSRIFLENEDIKESNIVRILENPSLVIDLLNTTKATFTQRDILKELNKRLDNAEQVSVAFERILDEAKYVGESARGEFLYTGEKYQKLESDTLSKFEEMSRHRIEKREYHEGMREFILSKDGKFGYLSNEQKNAAIGLSGKEQISVLVGKAGAGKTSTMSAVAEIYKHQGCRVIGMSLSAVASENLGNDANIDSKTIASWTHDWRSYEIAKEKFLSFNEIIDSGLLKQIDWYKDLKRYESSQLKKGDVIIVDEAGMVGTQNWNDILNVASRFGAKIIAVGDSNQFEAISSGDCFRKFAESTKDKGQLFELNEIRRQKQEWMKEASIEFSKLNTIEGLTIYENHGNIKELENRESVIKEAAESYIKNEEYGSTAVLCYKRATCREVNDEIRNIKRLQRTIGEDIATVNGINFAENDRIMFLQNDKLLNVKNGMTGTVLGGNEDILKVKTEDSRELTIDTKKYDKIDHGYAMTLHKSQGKTFDNVTVVAEKGMDAKATYVAMTRHKENVEMFYSKEDFSANVACDSFKSLTNELSKYRQKDLIADYQNIENENKTRVFEYQNTLIETASILREINKGEGNWKNYREVKNHSLELGREIHKDYENHKLYLDQSGITKEKLEISLGFKNRPLSNVEINARDRVKLYAKTSEETRFLLKSMKGERRLRAEEFNITKHEKYETYCDIREIRNDLAKEILENYPLHRLFINEFSRKYYISKKTMENQVAYAEKGLMKERDNAELMEFKQILNIEKREMVLKEDISDVMEKNIASDRRVTDIPITKATIAAYSKHCNVEKDVSRRFVMEQHASNLLISKVGNDWRNNATNDIIKECVRETLCFEALRATYGDNINPEVLQEINSRASLMAQTLKDSEMHLLNDKSTMLKLTHTYGALQNINETGDKNMDINFREKFARTIEENKFGIDLKEDIKTVMDRNIASDRRMTNIPITKATIAAYSKHCNVEKDVSRRFMLEQQAGEFLISKVGDDWRNATTDVIKECVKQTLCFEALRKELNINELTKPISHELYIKSEIMSNHLSDNEMHILSNKEFVGKLTALIESTGDFSKEKIMEWDNLEKFTTKLNQAKSEMVLKEDINAVMERNIASDRRMTNTPITKATIAAYSKHCNVERDISRRFIMEEHASNLLISKVGNDWRNATTEDIKGCIKETLCFEALKNGSNLADLSSENVKELHLRSAIMSHNLKDSEMHTINSKDLMSSLCGNKVNGIVEYGTGYDNAGKMAERLCEIEKDGMRLIDAEKSIDPAKELTPEIQKSQGFEMEI